MTLRDSKFAAKLAGSRECFFQGGVSLNVSAGEGQRITLARLLWR